jgi:hypothetical protein
MRGPTRALSEPAETMLAPTEETVVAEAAEPPPPLAWAWGDLPDFVQKA